MSAVLSEVRATATRNIHRNFANFGLMVSEMCEQRDRHTEKQIALLV